MRPESYLASRRRAVERALGRSLRGGPSRLREAVRYSLLGPGKRLRPLLVLAAGEACGGRLRELLPVACAVEMIHAYSLVHDDLPAMDDDDMRRGRPTTHRAYGEGLAVLAGDALLTEAFHQLALAALAAPPAKRRRGLEAIREIAIAAGVAGMVGGQSEDLAAEGRRLGLAGVRAIHRRKTGALIQASVVTGALIAGARGRALDALKRFGADFGLAYQIVDDLLDYGEAGGGGKERGKPTYPAVCGIAGAQRHAERHLKRALRALEPLGSRAEPLRALVRLVADRARHAAIGSAR